MNSRTVRTTMLNWSKRLIAWRQERQLTQAAVAEWLGVSRVTVARWEASTLACEHHIMLGHALNHWDCENRRSIQ